MSVIPRGGSWQAVFTHDGHRYRRQFPTKADAETWENEARSALVRGDALPETPGAGDTVTLGMALDYTYARYWAGSKSEKQTMLNGRIVVAFFGAETDVRNIKAQQIDAFVQSLKGQRNSNATINRKLSALSKIMSTAARYDTGLVTPKIEKLREPEGRTKVFTPEEIDQMCEHARRLGKPWLADMIIIGADTGLRLGEILKLTHEDFTLEGDDVVSTMQWWVEVRESKNGKSRRVPLTSRAATATAHIRGGGSVFPNVSAIQSAWGVVRTMMGKDGDREWVFHTLRHTFCSNLVRRGVDVLTVARLAGHSSVQVTMRYAKLAPNNLSEAIGVLN